MGIRFLAVDLDIVSMQPLKALVAALEDKLVLLYQGVRKGIYEAHFEAVESGEMLAELDQFFFLLENLSGEAKVQWESARERTFDIGFENNDTPAKFRSLLPPDTVRRVAALGAGIAVTIYERPVGDIAAPPPGPEEVL